MRSKLVVANWKMHGSSGFVTRMAGYLATETDFGGTDQVVICPPVPYVQELGHLLAGTRIQVGAQNLSEHESGAYTGEVSADMLRDLGCRWTIVGHSERRSLFAESSQLVANKALRALNAGLGAIVCVGETGAERDSGQTEAVVRRQLEPVLALEGLAGNVDRLVIAYEPVWAIGTGLTATPGQAQEVHGFIRRELGRHSAVPLLYGGSIRTGNAAELFAEPDIDGGLVGSASLVAGDFLGICRAMPD